VAAALDGIITIDHLGRIIEFNPQAERIFGYRRPDVAGRVLGDLLIPPGLREQHRRGLARCLATGEGPILGRRIELPCLGSDGSEFSIELVVSRIPAEGPPVFTAHVRDLAERKKAEEAMRESEEKYRRIVETANEGIWLLDADARITFVNHRM